MLYTLPQGFEGLFTRIPRVLREEGRADIGRTEAVENKFEAHG